MMYTTNERRKASIASGLYPNFSQHHHQQQQNRGVGSWTGTAAVVEEAPVAPPPYVTLNRRRITGGPPTEQQRTFFDSLPSSTRNHPRKSSDHRSSSSSFNSAASQPQPPRLLLQKQQHISASLRGLFSSSSAAERSRKSSQQHQQTTSASNVAKSEARLCASVGDISREVCGWSPAKFKSLPRRRASTTNQHHESPAIVHPQSSSPLVVCWPSRRRRKNSSSSNRSSSTNLNSKKEDGVEKDGEDEAYYYLHHRGGEPVELTKSTLLALATTTRMAPPQTNEKSGKSLKSSSTTVAVSKSADRPTSFMSRLFAGANSDKQRRKAAAASTTTREQSKSSTSTNPSDDGVVSSSTAIEQNGVEQQSTTISTTDDDGIAKPIKQHPAYSTSSLGRYATKLKHHLSPPPPVPIDREENMMKDSSTGIGGVGSANELNGGGSTNLGGANSNQLSTSLKTLSQLSTTKRELKLGAGSENDLYSTTTSNNNNSTTTNSKNAIDARGVSVAAAESNNDYRRSLISSLGAAAAAVRNRSSNNRAPSASNEETNKKSSSKSLISGSAFSTTTRRQQQQQRQRNLELPPDRSSSVSASSGSISKSAAAASGGIGTGAAGHHNGNSSQGLAGKISRGIIQEFASSSERLMSWKAKLKKTKRDDVVDGHGVKTVGGIATGTPTRADEEGGEEEEDEDEDSNDEDRVHNIHRDSDVFERQNLADFTAQAKSDPLPRAPKYVYKTNSIDSNYDMAMGAYDSADNQVGADQSIGNNHHWAMGQRRNTAIGQQQRPPDGFFVGLTLVNTTTPGGNNLELISTTTNSNPKAMESGGGVYFSSGESSSTSNTTTTGTTTGHHRGGGGLIGCQPKSNRVASHNHQAQEEGHPPLPLSSLLHQDDSTKHYEEIDLAAVNWKEPNVLSMDCHHPPPHHPYHHHPHQQHQYQGHNAGVYNVQQQHQQHSSGFTKSIGEGDENIPLNSGDDNVHLPPPTRITPFSGVPQAKDGEIVKPIAFRPNNAANTNATNPRSRSISNPTSTSNEMLVISPMKQQANLMSAYNPQHRHSSPSADLCHSNYDNTSINPDASHHQHHQKGASTNLSAFTPPSVRRTIHHLSLASSTNHSVDHQDEENSRLRSTSRNRESHSMTPARVVQTAIGSSSHPQNENSNWQVRVAQPPPPPPSHQPPPPSQTRPHPMSYQDYLRHSQQHLDQQHQRHSQGGPPLAQNPNSNANNTTSGLTTTNQNEYDVIPDVRPQPPNRSNFPITPTSNRSFDFNVTTPPAPSQHQQQQQQQQKKLQQQHPVPPLRTTASFASGHHVHPQQQQQQQQFGLHQPTGQTETTVGGGGGGSQNYGSLGSRNSSGIHITPSPSDSGVAELELALREKENELVHLRQTMEHNEQAIVRVYQDKEQRWQEKLREWAMRLEHAVSTEQRFLLEVDQLHNERTDLHNRVQALIAEKQGLQRKCKELETDLFSAKARLEERRQTNWIVCKQCGSVLTFESRPNMVSTSATSPDDDEMISSRESQHLPDPPYPPGASHSPRNGPPAAGAVRYRRTPPPAPSSMMATGEDGESPNNDDGGALRSEVDSLKMEVNDLRQSLHDQVNTFNVERRRWEVEKQRVLQYQKMLEDAYQMNCAQQQQQGDQRLSTHSTPTGTLKPVVNPYAYGSLQHESSPYRHQATAGNLNLVHSEPELEV